MALYESGQMYLETIHVLLEKNKRVRSIDIVNYLGYAKPSVSRAVGILKSGGYIAVDAEGYITLSESGARIAEQLYERHTILTKMLASLGVDEKIAAEDACKIEHVISDESFAAVKAHFLEYNS